MNIHQFRGGDRSSGTFIPKGASSSRIHLHIDIGSPHLQIGTNRYDLKGGSGYSLLRLRTARVYLMQEGDSSEKIACLNWLNEEIRGSRQKLTSEQLIALGGLEGVYPPSYPTT